MPRRARNLSSDQIKGLQHLYARHRLSAREIAAFLNISFRTVEYHIAGLSGHQIRAKRATVKKVFPSGFEGEVVLAASPKRAPPPPPGPTDIASQPLQDQVEHLRWAIEEITTPPPEFMASVAELGVHLTQGEGRMVGALMKHAGKPMTKEALLIAMAFDRHIDHLPDEKMVDVVVCKVRKKLQGSGFQIDTLWGQGYIGRYCAVSHQGVDPSCSEPLSPTASPAASAEA